MKVALVVAIAVLVVIGGLYIALKARRIANVIRDYWPGRGERD